MTLCLEAKTKKKFFFPLYSLGRHQSVSQQNQTSIFRFVCSVLLLLPPHKIQRWNDTQEFDNAMLKLQGFFPILSLEEKRWTTGYCNTKNTFFVNEKMKAKNRSKAAMLGCHFLLHHKILLWKRAKEESSSNLTHFWVCLSQRRSRCLDKLVQVQVQWEILSHTICTLIRQWDARWGK